jgi:hypothetical protein
MYSILQLQYSTLYFFLSFILLKRTIAKLKAYLKCQYTILHSNKIVFILKLIIVFLLYCNSFDDVYFSRSKSIKTFYSSIYINGQGVFFSAKKFAYFGRILSFEVLTSKYFHVVVL